MAFDQNYSRLYNANLIYDGKSMFGKVEEVNLPDIDHKKIEHKALGGFGTLKLRAGMNPMEATFKLNGPMEEISADGADSGTVHEFQFRGSNEIFKGDQLVAERPYVAIYRGTYGKSPGGSQKQHENIELTYTIDVSYYKLTIDGKVINEVDFVNVILKKNGVDLLAKYKSNLGIS